MSIPNSLLRLWAARLASKLALCSAVAYDAYQLQKARSKEAAMKLAVGDDQRRRLSSSVSKERRGEKRSLEDVFIEALVAAGSCRHCVPPTSNGWHEKRTSVPKDGRSTIRPHSVARRHFSTSHRQQQTATALPEPGAEPEMTREEALELVNTYDSPSDLWEQPTHHRLAPRLVIPAEQEDKVPPGPRKVLQPTTAEDRETLRLLRYALTLPVGRVSLTKLWNTFLSLPQPRPNHLADEDIRLAFRHLAWVEHRREPEPMPRYFALLEECLREGVPVEIEEWNTAISYAGRVVKNATSKEVKAAVETWMRMERHGHQADSVTFTILFDVAIKAGRFALADTIFAELSQRGMRIGRYFRVSRIYYAGIKGDGEGVRQGFRDLVNAGELVDTIVMNCVILSLVRAGEPSAAENVFEKMKRLHAQKLGADALVSWQDRKASGSILDQAARKLRKEQKQHEVSFFGSHFANDERKEEVQRLTPIAPGARAYIILIQHHAYTSGDYARVRALMAEMRAKGFSMHGSVYNHVLRGFWIHGGYAYTDWNRRALEELWSELLAAAAPPTTHDAFFVPQNDSPFKHPDDFSPEQSEEDRAPYFTKSLAYKAVGAFYKCAGRKRMLEVWRLIQDELWRGGSEDDREAVGRLVERYVVEDSVYVSE